jgi:hypothetical protein
MGFKKETVIFYGEYEMEEKVSMKRKNKLYGNDYIPCFNLYEDIIVILLIFKIYFNLSCKI